MVDLFTSAKSVFRRANHHITDLESTIQRFTSDDPYKYVIERDPDVGDYVHKIKFSEVFSDDLSCIMFDAVNNLRACLDQMTFAIAVRHRGGDKFAPFPFANDVDHWPDKINGLKHDIPVQIRTLFGRFQPYKGGNNTLWAVNRLANIKKHAILVPVGMLGQRIIHSEANIPPLKIAPSDRAEKNEVVVYRSSDPPNRHPNMEIAYNIVINHPEEVLQGQPTISFLNSMRIEVSRVLLDTEAECRRIGCVA